VGKETLINGITGVGVKINVGVSVGDGVTVSVGVDVGNSGVKVKVGSSVGCKVCDNAVWTNPAITVCAAAVLMAFGSWNETTGTTQARATIAKMATAKETRLERNMVPPDKFLVSYISISQLFCWAVIILTFLNLFYRRYRILFGSKKKSRSGLERLLLELVNREF